MAKSTYTLQRTIKQLTVKKKKKTSVSKKNTQHTLFCYNLFYLSRDMQKQSRGIIRERVQEKELCLEHFHNRKPSNSHHVQQAI